MMYKGCYISKSLKKSEKFLYWVFLIQSVEPRFHLPPFLHVRTKGAWLRSSAGIMVTSIISFHVYVSYVYVCTA